MAPDEIVVEVVYARPDEQVLLSLRVPQGTTLAQAVERSALLLRYPEIDLACHAVGIFGKVVSLETVLRSADRVEIYRPLIADPKDRRRRAARKASGGK